MSDFFLILNFITPCACAAALSGLFPSQPGALLDEDLGQNHLFTIFSSENYIFERYLQTVEMSIGSIEKSGSS